MGAWLVFRHLHSFFGSFQAFLKLCRNLAWMRSKFSNAEIHSWALSDELRTRLSTILVKMHYTGQHIMKRSCYEGQKHALQIQLQKRLLQTSRLNDSWCGRFGLSFFSDTDRVCCRNNHMSLRTTLQTKYSSTMVDTN